MISLPKLGHQYFGIVSTVAMVGAALYLFPAYIDYRIDRALSERRIAPSAAARTKRQIDKAQQFIASNRQLVFDGLPTALGGVARMSGLPRIVVFTDFMCSYCKMMEEHLAKVAPGSYEVLYRELPVLGDESEKIAMAAFVANSVGKYEEFRKAMLSLRPPTAKEAENFLAEHNIAPLRPEQIAAFEVKINETRKVADKLGIKGTPAIVIGDTILYGWNESKFSSAIKEMQSMELAKVD